MIYFDNSATTLQKPPEVALAVLQAMQTLGNPGRSYCEPSLAAARAVFDARCEIAKLVSLDNPLQVAFTSGATESMNLVIQSLIGHEDGVLTSVLEHNSVLRPLYRVGCPLTFLPCDAAGAIQYEALDALVAPNTRFLVCTHGSNVLGSLLDVERLRAFCRRHGLLFLLDVSQTLGCVETRADMADVLLFSGHKRLYGPQGTGGIIAAKRLPFRHVKTGGTGENSFARESSLDMPDVFEAGTPNVHGLVGLQKGAAFVRGLGMESIAALEGRLLRAFLEGIRHIPGLRVYGSPEAENRLPIVALNIADRPAETIATRLWDGWRIATRAGAHCAPLVHAHFHTEAQGMVRFSFSVFNTLSEIEIAVSALRKLAEESA